MVWYGQNDLVMNYTDLKIEFKSWYLVTNKTFTNKVKEA